MVSLDELLGKLNGGNKICHKWISKIIIKQWISYHLIEIIKECNIEVGIVQCHDE